MNTFTASIITEDPRVRTLIEVGFSGSAENDKIVPDAIDAINGLQLQGGRLICITGPASLPAAIAIAHAVGHLYSYVACYDPKMNGYVVAIAHGPDLQPGDLLGH